MLLITAAVAAVVIFAVWAVLTYNRLVTLRNRAEDAWAGIDVQLQRRADLVPNLVETVKGYEIHERETLESVTRARARIVEAEGPRDAGEADDALERSLGRLFAVAEAYPDLKASDNFLALQHELADLEEDISFARRYYNAVVKEFNTTQQVFPTVIVARGLGFVPLEFFKAEGGVRQVPGVGRT